MNPNRPLSIVLLACGLLVPVALPAADTPAAAAQKGAVALPQTPRFNQVRSRVEVLYRHRNEPPTALGPRSNPFRPPGASPAAGEGEGTPGLPLPPPEPQSDAILLEQGAGTLKVSGIFEIPGRTHVMINGRSYKEGDVVPAQVKGETIYLRVREIGRRSVTLALNEAEATLKF